MLGRSSVINYIFLTIPKLKLLLFSLFNLTDKKQLAEAVGKYLPIEYVMIIMDKEYGKRIKYPAEF